MKPAKDGGLAPSSFRPTWSDGYGSSTCRKTRRWGRNCWGSTPPSVCVSKRLVYVEQIQRYEYVVAGHPEEGVHSLPPPLAHRRGLQVRLQRHRRDPRDEVCLPHPDLSSTGLVCAMRLVSQSFHRERPNQLQCGHDRRLVWPDVVFCCLNSRSSSGTTPGSACCFATRSARRSWAAGPTQRVPRRPLDTSQPPHTGPPGSATSYAWLYTGLDGLARTTSFTGR